MKATWDAFIKYYAGNCKAAVDTKADRYYGHVDSITKNIQGKLKKLKSLTCEPCTD